MKIDNFGGDPTDTSAKKEPLLCRYYTRSDTVKDVSGAHISSVLDPAVREQIRVPGVVLDGEFVVWNRAGGYFEDFYSIKNVLSAIHTAVGPDDDIVFSNKAGETSGAVQCFCFQN